MKKSLLFALALSLCGATSLAENITAEQLNGKTVCQVYWGNDFQPGPSLSTVGKFSLEGDQLYIRNFRGRFKLPVTLSDNKIILPLLQTFYGEDPNNTTFQRGMLGATQGLQLTNGNGYVYTKVNGYPAACYEVHEYTGISTSEYSTDAYSNVGLPNFYIQKDHSVAFELNDSDSNFAIYKRMAFFIFDNTNATANDSNGLTYEMRVNLLDDNVISLPNLYNKGVLYQYDYVSNLNYNYSFKWIQGQYQYTGDNTGVIQIKSQYTGGTYSCGYYGEKTLYSGLSSYGYWTGYWFSSEGQKMNHQRLASDYVKATNENQFWPISGSFDVKKVYHETPGNSWAHHDKGELHTYEDWNLTIDKSVFYNQAATTESGRYGTEQEIDWTKINATKLDVTHHCAIDESSLQFGYGTISANNPDKYIYVGGQVNQLKNTHHLGDVDYYEYYIVPGTYRVPSGADFNSSKGHTYGLNVTDYVTDFQPGQGKNGLVRKANELNSDNSFNLLIPEKVFAANGIPTTGKYTLYVKANYKDSGLSSTFHALTPLGNPTTGVNDLVLDLEPASIEVVNGNIVIEGSNGTAMVSTLSGVVIYQGDDATVAVAPGTYIVRAGGVVKKLLVK